MASISWKRTRDGCLTCRSKRRKCDGSRPVCTNCSLKELQCLWGLKASFHPSRELGLTTGEKRALSAIERGRIRDSPLVGAFDLDGNVIDPVVQAEESCSVFLIVHKIIDETSQVARSYRQDESPTIASRTTMSISSDEGQDDIPPATLDSPEDQHPTIYDEIAPIQGQLSLSAAIFSHGGTALPSSDRPFLPPDVTSINPLASGLNLSAGLTSSEPATISEVAIPNNAVITTDAFSPPFFLGLAISRKSSPRPEPVLPISDDESLELVGAYLRETATWCETTDSEKYFSVISAHSMMEHKPFLASALALASRQIDAKAAVEVHETTLQLYQYTIQLLIRQDPAAGDALILATCVLLCVYEMMSSDVADWRRHLKGCGGLFAARSWNGSSSGLVKACFWAFARIDLWAAFVQKQRTLLPPDYWVDDNSLLRAAAAQSPDDYCNLMIVLAARVVNYLADQNGQAQSSDRTPGQHESARTLWHQVQRWWELRPIRVRPLCSKLKTKSTPFPIILFSQSSSICGNTFYHTASMLLLQTNLIPPSSTSEHPEAFDLMWHACVVCGISITNADHANWVNHLQPLCLAGQIFNGAAQPGIAPGSYHPHSTVPARFPTTSRTRATVAVIDSNPVSGTAAEEYTFSAEKIALLKHLARIQRETGWKTSTRAEELRKLWGLQ